MFGIWFILAYQGLHTISAATSKLLVLPEMFKLGSKVQACSYSMNVLFGVIELAIFCSHCGIGEKKILYIVMDQHMIERFVKLTLNQSVRSMALSEMAVNWVSEIYLFYQPIPIYVHTHTHTHTNTHTNKHLHTSSFAGVVANYVLISASLWWLFHVVSIFCAIAFPFQTRKTLSRFKHIYLIPTFIGEWSMVWTYACIKWLLIHVHVKENILIFTY